MVERERPFNMIHLFQIIHTYFKTASIKRVKCSPQWLSHVNKTKKTKTGTAKAENPGEL